MSSRASRIFGRAALGSSSIASRSSVSALARSCRPAAATPSALLILFSRIGSRLPRVRQPQKIGEFLLSEQRVCHNRQEFVVVAPYWRVARASRLADAP
jgi:hypothetical protein